MDIATLLIEIKNYLDPRVLIVIIVLIIMGYFLKQAPLVADRFIIWVLLLIGIALSFAIIGFDVTGLIQGILATAFAVFTNQLYKQTITKKDE